MRFKCRSARGRSGSRLRRLAHHARSGVRRTYGTYDAVDVPVRAQDGLAVAPFAAHVAARDTFGPHERATDTLVLAGHHGSVLNVYVADQRRDVAHVQAADAAHGGSCLGMRAVHVPAECTAVAGKAAAQLARVHPQGRGRRMVFHVRYVRGQRGEPSAATRERAVQRLRVTVNRACVSPQLRLVRAIRPASLAYLGANGQVPRHRSSIHLVLGDRRPVQIVCLQNNN